MRACAIEPEMLSFAKTLVIEAGASHLRRFHIEKIARRALFEDKIADESWLKERIAHSECQEVKLRIKRIVGKSLDSEAIFVLTESAISHRADVLNRMGIDLGFSQFLLPEEIEAFLEMFGDYFQ